ncbi:uncharacterized protein LOC130313384 isoform X2 [Hyla sarda]|uniref:uncharacterized protein LOC130313384 isoform X2 n=1 Tax=Hyla sarda TaxID=327740 RepID=UPI0024C2E38B|nr:uncharacterized protein LOC130313384 isoform X2 [Hyla sarda]
MALKDLNLFSCKLLLRRLHAKRDQLLSTPEEREAIQILEELLAEQGGEQGKPSYVVPTKSTTFPPLSLCPAIEVFTKASSEDLKQISSIVVQDNLTKKQRGALNELMELKDVVFKPADKGGNVVVWPISKYEREVFRQLKDKDTYAKLTSNPITQFSIRLGQILDSAFKSGIIDKKTHSGLMLPYPQTPTFYIIPKIHKDPLNPPGRPIVSGIDGICDPICKFIDYYLQPLVECLPSFIKDTTGALARIDGISLEPDMCLVTADVESLYTCIDHVDGLRAIKFYLDSGPWDADTCQLILELLEFVLTHNFFTFKNQFYLQKRGTAMGAACAPSYANLFLGYWERGLFQCGGAEAGSHVQCWIRYIDDILFVWQGSASQLKDFMTILNTNNINVKLTYKTSRECIEFLDILIKCNTHGSLSTDVYRKPTATNLLLHAASSHTPSTIKAIPTGQFLRIRRICSSDDDFKKQSAILTERFLQRGYSRRSLKKAYQKAQHVHREDLLQGRKKVTNKQSDNVRFISTYNCRWEQMRSCIQKNWAILQTDSLVAATLPPRVQMTARRSRNLRDMLVRSHYIANTPNLFGSKGPRVGCYPCGSCRACTNIQRATDFLSADGSRRYQIRQYISCTSTFVIYYATCGCSKIYIRLTSRELRIRTREHVRDILATKEEDDVTHLKTLPRHFNLPGGMILSGNLYQKRYNFFN